LEVEMDFEERYRAMETRDERYAGQFLAGVTSTGIYCRPGCPARTPKRENIRFYLTAAETRSDGFRACLRCRPDEAR
jgi:AraC family transcriptional regulator of adaptative response / DNA-3-methyladenine glycosylase II